MSLESKRKLALVSLVAVVSMAYLWFPYTGFQVGSSEPEFNGMGIDLLTHNEIRNPEIARKYGIQGYLEITLAPDSPSSLAVKRGGEASITILLHFVSYVPEVEEMVVKVDPESGEGLIIEKCYVVVDEKGNIIEEGCINVNEFVSYNPSGLIRVKAGQTTPIIMTIRIPEDFPPVSSFPLRAVGISASIPVIGGVEGEVIVYA